MKTVVLFILISILFYSCSGVGLVPEEELIMGRLRMVGNIPFNYLIISTENGENYIIDDPISTENLNKEVAILGLTYTEVLTSVDRKVTTERLHIYNVTIYSESR